METRETKKCPYCGEEILAVAKKCKHCGEWLPEPPQPKQMIPCPICGEEVEEGTEVCPHCNESIVGETAFSNPESQYYSAEDNKKKTDDTSEKPLLNEDVNKTESKEEVPPTSFTGNTNNNTSNVNKPGDSTEIPKSNVAKTNGESSKKQSLFILGLVGFAFVILIIVLLTSNGSSSNKESLSESSSKESWSESSSYADESTPDDSLIAYYENSTDNTSSESHTTNSDTGGWQKDYVQDEFGNKDTSYPYIYQIWSGRRNDTFDCELGIRITREFLQFTITEEYMHPNLAGAIVTGQMNGQKFSIDYDEANNESVFISNQQELTKVLSVLNTDGTLMLSFRRTDSFDETHNYLFTIYGSTNVYGAIKELLYDGTLPQN